jgi:hypothetical protein
MPSKQEPSEDVYDGVLQDSRDRARAVLPEPQTPAREGHLPRSQRLQRGHRYTTDPLFPSEPSDRWAMISILWNVPHCQNQLFDGDRCGRARVVMAMRGELGLFSYATAR